MRRGEQSGSLKVNEAILRERHPIPTVEELLQDMSESRVFTKLDLKMGYHQLELHPDSRDITTFVTHCGLFRYKRLVMGINAASEIYQHEIQKVVQGIPGVANLSDDIIVHAKNMKEHDERLRKTLHRLLEAGLTLNGEKCRYRKDEIEFLKDQASERKGYCDSFVDRKWDRSMKRKLADSIAESKAKIASENDVDRSFEKRSWSEVEMNKEDCDQGDLNSTTIDG